MSKKENFPEPQILYEDNHVLVISKPAGLLSQGESTAAPNVVDWCREYWGRPYVGLIHRLDRNTSGLMVIGQRTKSAQRLTQSLQSGKLQREYLAILLGTLKEPQHWRHSLVKDSQKNKTLVRKTSDKGAPQGKASELYATPLAQGLWKSVPVSLVKFTLETGRSHQIRAQAGFERSPLLGDVKYTPQNSPSSQKDLSREFGRPALHSFHLVFPHPTRDEVLEFHQPLPKDMAQIFPNFKIIPKQK
jgi:23S rRNA pseudouridine1911/1915/1917 synthase